MSNYGCQHLADDWMVSPLTPVLSTPSGRTSLNMDNYGDTQADIGIVQDSGTLYPNVPDICPKTVAIASTDSWAAFKALYDAETVAGTEFVFANGTYDGVDWETKTALNNATGTATQDSPFIIRSATLHGARFTGVSTSINANNHYNIWAGFHFDTVDKNYVDGVFDFFYGWQRVTCCKFSNCQAKNIWVQDTVGAGTRNDHCEFDNCESDGEDLTRTSHFFGVRTRSGTGATVVKNPKYFRVHHNKIHRYDATEFYSTGGGYNTDENQTTNYNVDMNRTYCIIENNDILDSDISKEAFVHKCGAMVFRRNRMSNVPEGQLYIRLTDRHFIYGNWFSRTKEGVYMSCVTGTVAFNYIDGQNFSSGAFTFHNDTGGLAGAPQPEEYAYRAPVGMSILNNVLNNGQYQVRNISEENPTNYVTYFGPSANVIKGNHWYSDNSTKPQSNPWYPVGGYLTESQFRTDNTWETIDQIFTNTPLSVTPEITKSLFDGPGDDLVAVTDFDATELYGQPSVIKMPTWWKQ